MKTVYLAGPISGLSYGACTDWREGVKADFAKAGITGLSPMRAKEYLASIASISSDGLEYAHMGPMSLPRGVMTRDRFDTQRCDVVLLNLLGATRVSIGSMIEIGWADSVRTPIVCAIESGSPNIDASDRAWLAGVIDGEGCIHLPLGEHFGLHLSVTQANLPFLEKVKAAAKGRGSIQDVRYTRTGKPYWRWHVMAQQAAELLRDIFPWLVVKRNQAALGIELIAIQGKGTPGLPEIVDRRKNIHFLWKQAQQGNQIDEDQLTTPTMFSSPMEHMMVSEAIGYRVTSLEQAVHVVKAILTA